MSRGLFYDRDYWIETPPPIQELALIPTPRGDDKSGGDGGSKDDNSKNRWFRNSIDFFWNFCGLQNPYRRAGREEVHEIARVQSHTSHVNWEELIKKREAMERGTTECKVHVKHENERNRLEAELFIKAEGSIFRAGWDKFFPSYNKLFFLTTGLVFFALGVYMAKGGVGVTARFYPSLSSMKHVEVAARIVEARLGKPRLVRDTSRSGFLGALRCPLQPSLEKKLLEVSKSTANTKKNKVPYRRILFCGPPGTGKKMFAKSLAKHSGMDYGYISGEDIVLMGKEGVTAIDEVFDWAQTSRRGLLLFVDDADAFLGKRNQEKMSEDLRRTLNALFHRTGEPSHSIMVVFAVNQPEQFDWAIDENQLDEMIEFGLPTLEERKRLVQLYFKKYVLNRATTGSRTSRIKIANFDFSKKCQQIAEVTEGLSGREISKIAIAWQNNAYGSPDGVLTEDMMDERVEEAVRQHKQKVE